MVKRAAKPAATATRPAIAEPPPPFWEFCRSTGALEELFTWMVVVLVEWLEPVSTATAVVLVKGGAAAEIDGTGREGVRVQVGVRTVVPRATAVEETISKLDRTAESNTVRGRIGSTMSRVDALACGLRAADTTTTRALNNGRCHTLL